MSSLPPIQILGAGSLGLGIGARLQAAHVPVQLIARDGRIQKKFIRVLDPRGAMLAQEDLEFVRLEKISGTLMVAVKAYDLQSALGPLLARMNSSARVLLLSNGIGLFEQLTEEMSAAGLDPAVQLMRGLAYFGFRRESDEIVRSSGDARLVIAGGMKEDRARLSELFRTAGFLQTEATEENPVAAEWKKALLNLAINGICARERIANGEVLTSPATLEEARFLVMESVQVASARGVGLGSAEQAWARVLGGIEATRLNRCSTLQDVESGRRTEIPFLNKRVADWALELGILAPKNRAIADIFS